MDIGFLWGQWLGLLGRQTKATLSASKFQIPERFFSSSFHFFHWGCLFFLRSESPWLSGRGLANGEPGSRTRAKLAIPVAEEPAAFGDVHGEINGDFMDEKPWKNLMS